MHDATPPTEHMIREPLGIRLLLRALRPEDDVPLLLWRAGSAEAELLIEAGEEPDRARLWAALLRWSEADAVARGLRAEGWQIRRAPVRVTILRPLAEQLQPPAPGMGMPLEIAGIGLVAVPEAPEPVPDDLRRMLAFLDEAGP